MIIETDDPGVPGVRNAVVMYSELYPDYAEALRTYGAIMEAQQEVLEALACDLEPLEEVEIEASLVAGTPLLDACEVHIDAAAYRGLVTKICAAVSEGSPDGLDFCGALVEWDGLSESGLPRTRETLLAGDDLDFEVPGGLSETDREIVKSILWEGLAPFYRVCGRILSVMLDQSLWQRTFCPVCGGAPLMGKYRQDDGLWIVECSLCHTGWNLQRTGCSDCHGSQGSLDYLYIEGDPIHRANYCSDCRRYIKTVDLRSSGEEALLPLENVITIQLDQAAREQGLTPASGIS
jgi:FdhE protein